MMTATITGKKNAARKILQVLIGSTSIWEKQGASLRLE
jgi:hypothetical protein